MFARIVLFVMATQAALAGAVYADKEDPDNTGPPPVPAADQKKQRASRRANNWNLSVRLTQESIRELEGAGCLFDSDHMKIIEQLASEGFTIKETVEAFKTDRQFRLDYTEMQVFSRDTVLTIAMGQRKKTSGSLLYYLVWKRHRFKGHYTITGAYNETVIGGPRLVFSGWAVTALGLAVVIGGGILYGVWDSNNEYLHYQLGNGDVHKVQIAKGEDSDHDYAMAMIILGGIGVTAGAIITTAGYYRKSTWLPEGTLDFSGSKKRGILQRTRFAPVATSNFWGVQASGSF